MFFRQKNALVLLYDPKTSQEVAEVQEHLEEVGKYYSFTTLSTLGSLLERKKTLGQVAICFKHPRKRLFLELLPELLNKEIPCTVFIRPECVGVNRLPREEELEAYEKAYPEYREKFQSLKSALLANPLEVDVFLEKARKEIGPLRVDAMDPLDFFVTWGKIVEIPPSLLDLGLFIPSHINAGINYESERKFLETQTKRPCTTVYAPNDVSDFSGIAIKAALGSVNGQIEQSSNSLNLPIWTL